MSIIFSFSEDEEIIVSTTRPETMLGDVAVAVHPDDVRYAKFIGSSLWHPFRNECIPVVKDNVVDQKFGTGLYHLISSYFLLILTYLITPIQD